MKSIHILSILLIYASGISGQDLFSNRSKSHNNINPSLITPFSHDAANRLYQFLYDNYGSKIVSGVMTLNSFDEANWLKEQTGKEPALLGLDFMHSGRGYQWYNDRQPIIDAKAHYARHGIPAICWHWRDPSRATEAFYTTDTQFDVSKVFDTTSVEYHSMMSDIDYISILLKELRDQNVPVIWRPLHEAAGGWFWWGAKGAAPCKKLYQLMFDRMVHHHGLNNLIWVWTREPNDDSWYPGDEYVDIVGRDIYRQGNHSSHVAEWSDLHFRYGERKMVTVSECGSFPDPDNLIDDQASWSWFMPWYGEYVRDARHNLLSLWQKAMAHRYVITLDEMPDLATYEGLSHEVVTGAEDPVSKGSLKCSVGRELVCQCGEQASEMKVYDVFGRLMISGPVMQGRINLDVSAFAAGMYIIKADNHTTLKVVVK